MVPLCALPLPVPRWGVLGQEQAPSLRHLLPPSLLVVGTVASPEVLGLAAPLCPGSGGPYGTASSADCGSACLKASGSGGARRLCLVARTAVLPAVQEQNL